MKLKLLTISSRTYSGRLMKASGCVAGNGNLIWVSVRQAGYRRAHLLDSFARSIIRSTRNSQHEDNDVSHEL
jgi:predicted Rdx family selenoprotein